MVYFSFFAFSQNVFSKNILQVEKSESAQDKTQNTANDLRNINNLSLKVVEMAANDLVEESANSNLNDFMEVYFQRKFNLH